jgi:predicted ABC-type ATPase
MKKDVRIIFEDTAYRYMPNTSIENDVLDKVRSTIDNKEFAGNFYSSLWQGGGDGYLYELDDYDSYVVRKEKLKEGEKIYRYFTRNSAITGQVPLIKINIDKGLLYFLKPDDEDLDLIEFETKGIPVRYLNIILREKEEYAEGGVLYDWEKEKDPSIVKVGWDAIKQKFDKIFWMEQDGDDEIFANEVKLEEPVYNWDGRPSPYTKRVSFSDAKSMFLRSLTDEEKAMIELEYDYKDVHELFGLMSEKKIIVKRKKDESKDFLSQLDEIDLSDPNLYMKNGGKLSRKNVLIQNSPINKSTNTKMKTSATLEGGVKKNMLFDKNGERRVDPEALEYIENTVEMLPQTKFMYTKENGEYTPERKKLHDEIIATFHEGKPCIDKRPAVAILTGGAPASGKTTFIKKYVDLDPDKVYHVDADEVRAMLPEYKGWNATQTHLETADLVNQLIDEIGVPCDHDLIYDGTMNKATKYEKIVNKLHKLGYKVFVVYISIPEQVSKERVIARYKKAGRYVPMKVIEEVYDNGLTAFEKVAHEMADGYIRIDGMNGEIIEQGGMSMPSNIEYEKGGKIGDEKLKNGTALVRSAERFAEMETGKPVKKGRGIASATISDGKRKYKSVTVFFEDGSKTTFDEETFPKFFLKDGGELGGQDYYDGFQMQVVQKKGIPDKEAQKENIKMTYRKGGKL